MKDLTMPPLPEDRVAKHRSKSGAVSGSSNTPSLIATFSDDSLTQLNIESLNKVISASKKRELNLTEQLIYQKSENEKLKKNLAKINSELTLLSLTNKKNLTNFCKERDELLWTIKLLNKSFDDAKKEIELYSSMKKESEEKYVEAIKEQGEIEGENKEIREQNEFLQLEINAYQKKEDEYREALSAIDGIVSLGGQKNELLSGDSDLIPFVSYSNSPEPLKIIDTLLSRVSELAAKNNLITDLTDHTNNLNALNQELALENEELEDKFKDLLETNRKLRENNAGLTNSLRRAEQQEKETYQKYRKQKNENAEAMISKYLSEADILDATMKPI